MRRFNARSCVEVTKGDHLGLVSLVSFAAIVPDTIRTGGVPKKGIPRALNLADIASLIWL